MVRPGINERNILQYTISLDSYFVYLVLLEMESFVNLKDPIGPFPIPDIYTNGTVRDQRGIINERINIR